MYKDYKMNNPCKGIDLSGSIFDIVKKQQEIMEIKILGMLERNGIAIDKINIAKDVENLKEKGYDFKYTCYDVNKDDKYFFEYVFELLHNNNIIDNVSHKFILKLS